MSTRNRTILLAALAAVGLLVAVVGAFALDIKQHQWKIYDEWECSRGEAPYVYKQGGSNCARLGSRLPKGAHWDPLGNRPFDCTDRDGWILIEGTNKRGDGLSSCYPDDKPLPRGWHR